ncbi:MAG TPA: hypothetical protein VKS21_11075, partial [Spirochaetota bacterium]|nr:hypothetical protein [Spirochaetota bacterium]
MLTRTLKIFSKALIVVAVGLTFLNAAYYYGPGTEKHQILFLSANSRGYQMADSMAAVADPLASAYYNPAGLGFCHDRFITAGLGYTALMDGINYFNISGALGLKKGGAVFVGVNLLGFGQFNFVNADGSYTWDESYSTTMAASQRITLGYGKAFLDMIAVGLALDILHDRINDLTAPTKYANNYTDVGINLGSMFSKSFKKDLFSINAGINMYLQRVKGLNSDGTAPQEYYKPILFFGAAFKYNRLFGRDFISSLTTVTLGYDANR